MKKLNNINFMIIGLALCMSTGIVDHARAEFCTAPDDGHAHNDEKKSESDHAQSVPVTQEQVARLGIKISRAVKGSVHSELRVPGEIKVNSDRVTHVVPRAAGIVRVVTKELGDLVQAGEILAWIESDELVEAKLDFYAKESEVGCCEIALPRAKSIFENVTKLIALLKQNEEVSEKDIHEMDGLEMGTYRGQLLTAHTLYRTAITVYNREQELRTKEISSGQDLLTAQTDLKQARAELHAILDTARYETMIAYTEAVQERQVAVFNAIAAEKRLRLKGADDEVIVALRTLVPKVIGLQPCECDDANCQECKDSKTGELPSVADAIKKDTRFAWYPLRAPSAGTLIEKHIVKGESINTASDIFTIADLSTVWIDLAISQDAISSVQKGNKVIINLPVKDKPETVIEFLSPIVEQSTRTALARGTLNNANGDFRPGTFIEAIIQTPGDTDGIIIPKDSVQLINDHPSVFVWGDAAFELREVTTGVTDGQQVEIIKGLNVGEAVASENAFHLKAEYIKSMAGDLGAHQGHSH